MRDALPIRGEFAQTLSSQPLPEIHAILRFFVENDEICFELQNTHNGTKARVWLDKAALGKGKHFLVKRAMVIDDTDSDAKKIKNPFIPPLKGNASEARLIFPGKRVAMVFFAFHRPDGRSASNACFLI
ncbi:MAG: hypothetical protein LBD14_06115 [Puniceicoccales bacterium]|jgi:hypothetical protein|nr:hypothetical protein [Puniceicoccales bacterium]